MRLLEGEGIIKHFGGLTALANVNFHIDRGEILGLIGPNGAGKTTLFNLISGSLVPTSGTIKFKGENITGLKPHRICRKGIARTFQLVKLFGNMTVLENILLGALFGPSKNSHGSHKKKECLNLLEFVGLSEMQGSLAKDLTIINQKRLEVARALATKPELLMLDEFMAGLNPTEIVLAIDLIKKIHERGMTIFMIEHVMKVIMDVSDRIVVLHHGEKIAEGIPEQIATNQMVIDVYLGT
ncbi:MAG: ABC transporter ATP-binding protein [Euryarchaeota archaeon]|nr:ABC transporter ATP-binding protein [Euryarchaeota archaeon]